MTKMTGSGYFPGGSRGGANGRTPADRSSSAAPGKWRVGVQLEERYQHEATLVHAWMGHLEAALVDLFLSERQDVQIDNSRAPPLLPYPAESSLRFPACFEQFPSGPSRLHLGHCVQVVGLRGTAHRIGLVHARGSDHAHAAILQELQGPAEIVEAVAEVRAQPNEGPGHATGPVRERSPPLRCLRSPSDLTRPACGPRHGTTSHPGPPPLGAPRPSRASPPARATHPRPRPEPRLQRPDSRPWS